VSVKYPIYQTSSRGSHFVIRVPPADSLRPCDRLSATPEEKYPIKEKKKKKKKKKRNRVKHKCRKEDIAAFTILRSIMETQQQPHLKVRDRKPYSLFMMALNIYLTHAKVRYTVFLAMATGLCEGSKKSPATRL
jgi:hypothetical protein